MCRWCSSRMTWALSAGNAEYRVAVMCAGRIIESARRLLTHPARRARPYTQSLLPLAPRAQRRHRPMSDATLLHIHDLRVQYRVRRGTSQGRHALLVAVAGVELRIGRARGARHRQGSPAAASRRSRAPSSTSCRAVRAACCGAGRTSLRLRRPNGNACAASCRSFFRTRSQASIRACQIRKSSPSRCAFLQAGGMDARARQRAVIDLLRQMGASRGSRAPLSA